MRIFKPAPSGLRHLAVLLMLCPFETASAQTSNIAEVWELEAAYWEYVQSGDVDSYLTLWHEDFIGWPCAAGLDSHPAGKSTIGDWVRRIRDEEPRFTYDLQQEGAEDFGTVVVVHYRTPMTYEYPDGRVVGKDQSYKFTHTWMRVGSDWQIVGGMCAPLE